MRDDVHFNSITYLVRPRSYLPATFRRDRPALNLRNTPCSQQGAVLNIDALLSEMSLIDRPETLSLSDRPWLDAAANRTAELIVRLDWKMWVRCEEKCALPQSGRNGDGVQVDGFSLDTPVPNVLACPLSGA